MPNNYFRFKEFTIYQDNCTMKVNTDSCIFGAAVYHDNPSRILDIGTGSGVLALMMAQRFKNAVIDAIEPDTESAGQAESNFRNSPWAGKIRLYNTDIEHFTQIPENNYDLVVTNPPWFNNSLKSADKRKNSARHVISLTWEKLSSAVNSLLVPDGIFYSLLPACEFGNFRTIMESEGFTLTRQVSIKNHSDDLAGRIISGFTRETIPIKNSVIVFKDLRDCYSREFKSLLKDFYLAF